VFALNYKRQRDRLAILVQVHQHRHALFLAADAQMKATDQAIQGPLGIVHAALQFIAQGLPGSLPFLRDPDAILAVESTLRGHVDGRAVRQGQATYPDTDDYFSG
jgi:hypothetical protein